jgi:type II secretory pathway pseudopilin PulG
MNASPPRAGAPLSLRPERGEITLVELLVAAPIALILLTATLTLQLASGREQERTNDRAQSLLQQRQGLERMTRELRQATSITPTSSVAVDAVVWLRPPGGGESEQRQVRYDCSGQACVRREGPVGSSLGASVVVVADVLNADVFDFQPDLVNPTYVTITLEVRVKTATNPISLHDGVALRNLVNEE